MEVDDHQSMLGEQEVDACQPSRRQRQLPVLPVEKIVAANRELIDRIQLTYGEGRASFESDLMGPVTRYMEFVNTLPATRHSYFSQPSGLARMGLEVAFHALQAADAQIFAGRSSITVRRQLEPRWRQATFFAGLCSELFRCYCHVEVTAEQPGRWSPYVQPLTSWAKDRKTKEYMLTWEERGQDDRYLSMYAAQLIIPAKLLQYLTSSDTRIPREMFGSIAGTAQMSMRNVLDQLVRRSAALVIGRELRQLGGEKHIERGGHWGRHALDAMRHLLTSNPQWQVNAAKSRVWYGQDGLFVVWPNAYVDIAKTLESFEYLSYPSEGDVMLQTLCKISALAVHGAGGALWTIQPPEAKTAMQAIKLANPLLLLGELATMPAALGCSLGRSISAAAAESPAAVEPPASPASSAEVSAARSGQPVRADICNAVQGKCQAEPDPNVPATPRVPGAQPEAKPRPGPSAFALNAPLQLPADVKAALADIIGTLSDMSQTVCCTTPHGVFVPLKEFDIRGVHHDIATRGLRTAGMLIPYRDGQFVIAREMLCKVVDGVVVDPAYVRGLDVADFARPD